MINISERIRVRVEVDGEEFPITLVSPPEIVVHTRAIDFLPTLDLMLPDPTHLVSSGQFEIIDNTPITIGLDIDGTGTEQFRFRVFSIRKDMSQNTEGYCISGIWDAPRYVYEAYPGGLNGTSKDVIQQIANDCGLKFKGDNTLDIMTWLSGNRPYAGFARYIANHGWAGNSSLMVLGCTTLGELRYLDFNQLEFDPEKHATFRYPVGRTNQEFGIQGYQTNSTSGIQNALAGYKYQLRDQNTDVGAVVDTVNIKQIADRLMFNTEVQSSISRARLEWSPIHAGDTLHAHFHEAKYANKRASLIHSTKMHIATNSKTGADLYDPVRVEVGANVGQRQALETDSEYSGAYVITAKTLAVKGINYSEQFDLIRDGINRAA